MWPLRCPVPSGPNQWPPEGDWQPLAQVSTSLPGAGTEAPTDGMAPWGTREEGGPEQGSSAEATTVPSTPLFTPSRPPSGVGGLCRAWAASSGAADLLMLSTSPQRSCTCHPGPPACPAPSARSTRWQSCAPTSGPGPVPSPSASRSPPPTLPAEGAPPGRRGNSPGWAEIGREAPLQEAPKAEPLTLLPGVPLA